MERFAVWQGLDEWRLEVVRVRFGERSLAASGVQFATGEHPYRLQYALETDDGFVTRCLALEVEGPDWKRSLRLERAADGGWTPEIEGLEEALDCDLGLSPLTNLMPIRRDDLHARGGSRDITVAWVAVPELTVHAARQRYTHVRPGLVRFRSLDGEFEGFEADLEVDGEGLIVKYPDLAWRTGELALDDR
jgi:hypothetical protein